MADVSLTIVAFGIGLILFIIAPVVVFLGGDWIPFYNPTGIILYRSKISLPNVKDLSRSFSYVKSKFSSNIFKPEPQFRKIGDNLYAFRCNPFRFHRDRTMSRIIRFDPTTNEMEITGYLSWVSLLLLLAIFIVFITSGLIGEFSLRGVLFVFFAIIMIGGMWFVLPYNTDVSFTKEVEKYIKEYFGRSSQHWR
jgi:hypothetical protein